MESKCPSKSRDIQRNEKEFHISFHPFAFKKSNCTFQFISKYEFQMKIRFYSSTNLDTIDTGDPFQKLIFNTY